MGVCEYLPTRVYCIVRGGMVYIQLYTEDMIARNLITQSYCIQPNKNVRSIKHIISILFVQGVLEKVNMVIAIYVKNGYFYGGCLHTSFIPLPKVAFYRVADLHI